MQFIDEQDLRKEIGIYRIVNLVNGYVYIGQTKECFQRRFWLHRWKLRNGSHDNRYLQNAWNKYGEVNFEFQVLEVLDVAQIDNRERYWISYYRENGGCYSIQDGGQPLVIGKNISPETRKRVGELNKKRMMGRKLSQETKSKMSKSRKGKHPIRRNDLLTISEAELVKKLLVSGMAPREIVDRVNVPYKAINGIISKNHYESVRVDGWDEYYAERKASSKHRLTQEQISALVSDVGNGMSVLDAAKKYNVGECSVRRHVRLHK